MRRSVEPPRHTFHLRWTCGNADCELFNTMVVPAAWNHTKTMKFTDVFCFFSDLSVRHSCLSTLKLFKVTWTVTRPLSMTASLYSAVDIRYRYRSLDDIILTIKDFSQGNSTDSSIVFVRHVVHYQSSVWRAKSTKKHLCRSINLKSYCSWSVELFWSYWSYWKLQDFKVRYTLDNT